MRNAAPLVGAALVAAALALSAPASATPAITAGLSDAVATAAAAPGAIGPQGATGKLTVQDSGLKPEGARVGVSTVDGAYSKAATDGTITPSASFSPAL